jgi:carotenoid 1,2-hydratase
LSDCGNYGLTIIAFVGSVFSPYYTNARRRQGDTVNPENHVALNVALYGRKRRWAMTERSAKAMHRDASTFSIGPSSLKWDGTSLLISIDEVTVPIPTRLRGTVRITPTALPNRAFVLDSRQQHIWRPIGPLSRIELNFENPRTTWSGRGYFDFNMGAEPIDRGFQEWDWSRSTEPDRTRVLYDTIERNGQTMSMGLTIDRAGAISEFALPPRAKLPPARIWRAGRTTRSETPGGARVLETLEDTPFYARSVVSTTLDGQAITMLHETLHCDRLIHPIVQTMLPFRMPRRA